MPLIYELSCPECENEWDLGCDSDEEVLATECPECNCEIAIESDDDSDSPDIG